MRHAKKGRQIGSDIKHRKAILRGLASQVIEHGKLKTTHAKAAEVQPFVENLITLGVRGDIHARRVALSKTGNNKEIVQKLFSEVAPKYVNRDGGYTSIHKLGRRQGDGALIVQISLVE